MNNPTPTTSLYPLLLDYLGFDSENKTIIDLLENTLETYDKPDFDNEDDQDVYDWVLVQRKGVELGFVDRAYHKGKPYYAWYSDGALLTQVYFYCGFDDVAPYVGKLPNKITWRDDRVTVLKKMQVFSNVLRQSSITDVWEFDDYLLTINYNKNTQLVERIVFHLTAPPLPLPKNIKSPPFIALVQHLCKSITDDNFISLWQNLLDNEMINSAYETDKVDLSDSFGIIIHTSSQTGQPLLQSITFLANRELDSVGWQGQLPFGLEFSDSPDIAFKKIANAEIQPRIDEVDVNDGYAFGILNIIVCRFCIALLSTNYKE